MDEQNSFDPLETLTVREAAALLHVSRPTVEKYVKRGELPSVQIGRCRRIRRTAIEAFLQGRSFRRWRPHKPDSLRPDDTPTDRPEGQDDIPY